MSGLRIERESVSSKITRRRFGALAGVALIALLSPKKAEARQAEARQAQQDPLAELKPSIPSPVFPSDPKIEGGGYLGKSPETEAVAADMFKTIVAAAKFAGGDLAKDAAWYEENHSGFSKRLGNNLAASLDWRAPTTDAIQGIIEGKPFERDGKPFTPKPNPGFKPVQDSPFHQVYEVLRKEPDTVVAHHMYINGAHKDFDPFSLDTLYAFAFLRARIEKVNSVAAQAASEGKTDAKSLLDIIIQPDVQKQIYASSALTALKRIGEIDSAANIQDWSISPKLNQRLTQVNEAIKNGGDTEAIKVLIQALG